MIASLAESSRLPLRRDIQILRAIAIIVVVIHHAQLGFLSGGFVGVDVFFVISGYLMTGLILNEIKVTGQFHVMNFFAARMRRLLPSLLLVLLVGGGICFALENPKWQSEQIQISQSVLFWWSNIFFASHDLDYFSQPEDHSYWMHAWSLSVEEQFYFIWPWVILFLLGAYKWQARAQINQPRLLIGMLVLALISMGLNLYFLPQNPHATFFMMPTRMWEFILGGAAFYFTQNQASLSSSILHSWRGRGILNTVGLVCIIIACVSYSSALRYPGVWALLPCLGSALILLDTPLARFWHAKPLHYIGNISYSWYLWHWPVMIFAWRNFENTWSLRLACVVLSFLLAAISYQFLEKPIQRFRSTHWAKIFASSVIAFSLALLGLQHWESAKDQLAHDPRLIALNTARNDLPILYQRSCDTWYYQSEITPCEYGSQHAEQTVVLLGDSTAAMWFPALKELFVDRRHWKLLVLTKSACPLQDAPIFYERINRVYTECDVWRKKAFDYVQNLRPNLIIAGGFDYEFDAATWRLGLEKSISRLAHSTPHLWLLQSIPKLKFHAINCLEQKILKPSWLRRSGDCQQAMDAKQIDFNEQALTPIITHKKNVQLISLFDLVCPNFQCHAQVGEQIVFRDYNHVSARFAASLSLALENILPWSDLEN